MMCKKSQKQLNRKCDICGKNIKILVEQDGRHRGGNYFGKIEGMGEQWECSECWGK